MGKLRELFCEQEQQRRQLLLQHSKERVSRFSATDLVALLLQLLLLLLLGTMLMVSDYRNC